MSDEQNWLPLKKLKIIGWASITNDFFLSQDSFKEILSEQEDDFLLRVHKDSGYSYGQLAESIIHHDIYHLGQINLTFNF